MNINKIIGGVVMHCRRRKNFFHYYFKGESDAMPYNAILMITRGKALFDFGKVRLTAGKDDIICHSPSALKESYPLPGQTLSYVVLDVALLSADGEKPTLEEIGFPFLLNVAHPREVRALLEKIEKTFNSGEKSRLPECSIMSLQLLRTIERDRLYKSRLESDPGPELHLRIRETLEHIRKNYKKRLAVEDLARQASMHPAYFAHFFKKAIGVSPHQYVLDYKIEKAMEFLNNYNESLSYVAGELGFHDYSHFYRAFKKSTGTTPMAYIKKSKGKYDPRYDTVYRLQTKFYNQA